MSQKKSINSAVDAHFAFAVLILVTAVLFFTFWIDYAQQRDRELLIDLADSQQEIFARINQLESQNKLEEMESMMQVKEGSMDAMQEGLNITSDPKEVLRVQQ